MSLTLLRALALWLCPKQSQHEAFLDWLRPINAAHAAVLEKEMKLWKDF